MVQLKGLTTDVFRSNKWESLETYTFNDGTSDVPPDLPLLETNENHLSTGFRVVCVWGVIPWYYSGHGTWIYCLDISQLSAFLSANLPLYYFCWEPVHG